MDFENADAFQAQEQAHALRLVELVELDHLVDAHLVQGADGDQEQRGIGHQLLFLLSRQPVDQPVLARHAAGELRQVHLHQLADNIQAIQRAVLQREDPLYRRLGNLQGPRDIGVGHAPRLEVHLESLEYEA